MSIVRKVTNIIKASHKNTASIDALIPELLQKAHDHGCFIQATRLVKDVSRGANPEAIRDCMLAFCEGVKHESDVGFKTKRRTTRVIDMDGAKNFFANGGSYLDFAETPKKAAQELTWERYIKGVQASAMKAKSAEKNDKPVANDPRIKIAEKRLEDLLVELAALKADA